MILGHYPAMLPKKKQLLVLKKWRRKKESIIALRNVLRNFF